MPSKQLYRLARALDVNDLIFKPDYHPTDSRPGSKNGSVDSQDMIDSYDEDEFEKEESRKATRSKIL